MVPILTRPQHLRLLAGENSGCLEKMKSPSLLHLRAACHCLDSVPLNVKSPGMGSVESALVSKGTLVIVLCCPLIERKYLF